MVFEYFLDLLSFDKNFLILAIIASTNRRTFGRIFFAKTVVIVTIFFTSTSKFINFISLVINHSLNKGIFVDLLSFLYHKLPDFLIFFSVIARITLAVNWAKTQFFKTWAMESEAIWLFTRTAFLIKVNLFFRLSYNINNRIIVVVFFLRESFVLFNFLWCFQYWLKIRIFGLFWYFWSMKSVFIG